MPLYYTVINNNHISTVIKLREPTHEDQNMQFNRTTTVDMENYAWHANHNEMH